MTLYGALQSPYCRVCYPGGCECQVPRCDGCSGRLDAYTAVTCWACDTETCEDCIDAYGWPCSHFSEQ